MVRQSVARRDLRKTAPYESPLPAPSGAFSRPSTSGTTFGGGYQTYRLIRQLELAQMQEAIDNVFTMKFDVHGDRLSTIIPTPE